ncbi:MAG: HlyD family efflux transporter periplasmic adaptor subunit [Planctomycetota bacterium]|nr:HlyD family efflux transporter periplasmic adaptor subunit [Planctomycetota bacterium]
MTKWIIVSLGSALIILIGTLLYLRSTGPTATSTYTVVRGNLSRTARGVGKVEGTTDAARMAFLVPGRIKSIAVEEGQKVAQGAVLAEIDASQFDLDVAVADAALKEAQAHLALAGQKPRAEELQQAEERLKRATLETKAADLRLKALQQPPAPPPALAWQIQQAAQDAERARNQFNEAAYQYDRLLKEVPSQDELAVALAQVKMSEWDFEDAQKKNEVAKQFNYTNVTGAYGPKPEWLAMELANNMERMKRKLELARADYDRIKRGPSNNEKEAAKSRSMAARAAYDNALLNKERLEKPVPPPPAAENEIDLAKIAYAKAQSAESEARAALDILKGLPRPEDVAAAQAAVDRAQKSLEMAKAQKDKCTLTAPFDGTVVGRFFEPGSSPPPYTPVLAISDLNHLRVRAEVPADWSGELKDGQDVTLTCTALNGETVKGKITRILETIGTKSIFSSDPRETKGGEVATILVALDPNLTESAKAVLRAGLRLDVVIQFKVYENVICVPKSFVTWEDNKAVVYKVEPGAAPKAYPVDRGVSDDFTVEIKNGVGEGDRLVKSPRTQGR